MSVITNDLANTTNNNHALTSNANSKFVGCCCCCCCVSRVSRSCCDRLNRTLATITTGSTSLASVEEQAALFEDILHPEVTEAVDTLQQLDFEEQELINQLKKLTLSRNSSNQPSHRQADRDYAEALLMELNLRRKEKVDTM